MPLKRAKWPNLLRSEKGRRIHYSSDAFSAFSSRHNKIIATAYKLLLKHGFKLKRGTYIEEKGVAVGRYWADRPGYSNISQDVSRVRKTMGTFKVKVSGLICLVKFKESDEVERDITKLSELQKWIDNQGGVVNGVRVRTAKVFAARVGPDYNAYVSEFLLPSRFVSSGAVSAYKLALWKNLSEKILAKKGFFVATENAFF